MNTREIEILLDKYFEGESSLDEERVLKEFFNSGEVPENLKEYSGMFGYFNAEVREKLNPEIEKRIMEKFSAAHQIPFYQNRRFWYYFTGVAASLLFLFTFLYESEISGNLGFGKQYSQQEKQLAYMQVKQTLGYVSGKMNEGIGPLQEMEKINATSIPFTQLGKFEKSLAQVGNNMDKMDRSVENMTKFSKFTIIIKP
jgi:hypothetical protein